MTPLIRKATLCLILAAFSASAINAEQLPIDRAATAETRNLFNNMMDVAPDSVMFGHQNTLAYGYSWRDEGEKTEDRSDVKDVTGAFPAVYGWDLMDVLGKSRPGEMPGAGADQFRAYVQSAHARGGINTVRRQNIWH